MRAALLLGVFSGSAIVLWSGVSPDAWAGTCLLCIWQAAAKDAVWTIHLLMGVWIAFLYPITLSIWRPEWAHALPLRWLAAETMLQMGVPPDSIAPGYGNLAYRSRRVSPTQDGTR